MHLNCVLKTHRIKMTKEESTLCDWTLPDVVEIVDACRN